ncbi:MAG: hypothetical protein OXI90_02425 [Gammaproteobacteria bacterium]|nr:hypothetical protein [Gammaproteobacteria bacterium]
MSSSKPETRDPLLTWPWRKEDTSDDVQVYIDDAGGLFVDPDELAESDSFQTLLNAMAEEDQEAA